MHTPLRDSSPAWTCLAHISLCIAVVSVPLTIVTRTSSSQSSNVRLTFICAGAVSNMLHVSENVLCNRANKHRSACPLGTRCPPPASQHGSLWSTAVSGQTNHQNPLSFMRWRGVRRQKRFSIPPTLCFVCIRHVDQQNLVYSHSQTRPTTGDPINVYSGSKTQRWSSHLPQLLWPTFDPQGLTDNCCAAMHVKATSSRNRFYQCSVPVGRQRLLLVIVLAKGFLFFSPLK